MLSLCTKLPPQAVADQIEQYLSRHDANTICQDRFAPDGAAGTAALVLVFERTFLLRTAPVHMTVTLYPKDQMTQVHVVAFGGGSLRSLSPDDRRAADEMEAQVRAALQPKALQAEDAPIALRTGNNHIEPVTTDNIRDWAGLNHALWPEAPLEEFLPKAEKGVPDNEFLYYLASEPVAFISLSLRRDYVEGTRGSPVGYVEGIYVAPEVRGRGIAAELIDFARAWAAQQGCSELASDCELENEESQAFHRAVGFAQVNTIVCFVTETATGEDWPEEDEDDR